MIFKFDSNKFNFFKKLSPQLDANTIKIIKFSILREIIK